MNKVKSSKNKAKDVEGVTKELFIADRFAIVQLLPKEGDILSLTIARDIREKMKLTQAEIEKHEVKKRGEDELEWKIEKNSKKFVFTNAEFDFLKSQIDILDNQKKISSELLDICLLIKE